MSSAGTERAAATGSVIAGRFRIEGELGGGGMAQVFRATDLAGGKAIALKLLKPSIEYDEEAIARLRREGEILSKLDTPAIVGIETFGRLDDGRIFIAMELLEGETLGAKMRREGRADAEKLTPIVTGLAAGLSAAHHAGVIHRDLKPDNVFLTRADARASVPTRVGDTEAVELGFGTDVQVKLVDFGISKAFDFARLTRTGQILGTPRYMAPEQLAADDSIDARVDIYALGVILYEALAGTPPFVSTSPSGLIVAILHGKVTPLSAHRPDLSDEVVAVVSRAMARTREARYATAQDLAEAWLAVTHAPVPAGPRAGMRTNVLGGLAFPVADASSSGELRVGTFSAMEQRSKKGGSTSAKKPTAPVSGPAATPPERLRGRVEMPVVAPPTPTSGPGHEHGPTSPSGSGAQFPASTPTPYGADTGPLPALPTNSSRTGWIIAALVAGALSAAVVILALQVMNRGRSEPAPVDEAPAVAPDQEPVQTDDVPTIEGVAPEAAPTLAPDEVHDEAREVQAISGSRTARGRASSRTGGSSGAADDEIADDDENADERADPQDIQPFVPDPGPQTPGQIATAARARLRAGDGDGCLQLLAPLGTRLSAGLRRLEADCHLRAGHRDDALKAYEQYCADHPTGSDIDEVRALVASFSGFCPQ